MLELTHLEGPLPVLVCEEDGVDLALQRGVEVPPGQQVSHPLVLEHPEVRLSLSEGSSADAVLLRSSEVIVDTSEDVAVLGEFVQLGSSDRDIKHLRAGLARGKVRHSGDERWEWFSGALRESFKNISSVT